MTPVPIPADALPTVRHAIAVEILVTFGVCVGPNPEIKFKVKPLGAGIQTITSSGEFEVLGNI